MRSKKQTLLLVVLVLSLLTLCAFAAAAETEGIFTYTVSGGAATINRVDCSGQTEIDVPETLGGVPVTAFGSQAFNDPTYELGVDTVQVVRIPKTVTAIHSDAFSYADVAAIEADADNPNYSSDDFGVLFNKDKTTLVKAPCCLALTSYTVPDSVTHLEGTAFEGVIFLQALSLPDGLADFGPQAFYEMQSLKHIALPEGITAIGQNDFAYCVSLESVSLPSTLQSIEGSAFTECYALKEIIIPEGVTSIRDYAFESDAALERIVLPRSLQTIGRAICGNCPNLAHVYYAGSAEDWAALNVRTGSYYGSRVDAFDVAAFHYDFDAAPYATLTVTYDNDLLTIAGTGSIPAAREGGFQFWDEHKDTVTALFVEGGVASVGAGAFTGFPALSYVIFDTGGTAISAGAFTDCPALDTLLFYGDAALDDEAADADAAVQVFVPADAALTGSLDAGRYRVVPYTYADGALSLNGSVTWDGYQFLDTMTAFCLRFDPIDVLKCSDFTFDALPMYGTDSDGNYARIEDNRLADAELRAQTSAAEPISFNDLVRGIVDGSITDFRLVAKDSAHEEISDTPVEIKDENEGVIGFIHRAIKWIVRLLDSLLNIVSKLKFR
ncbi:MAG: leucine-rich repeat domain-containing protein [Clostridia bacterium]|nr:leucine-rich repeat domain-containing protein [Clostridia bacterium]